MAVVTPIVLAAGAATRMGRPKALLPFGEDTCLSLVLRACRDGGAGPPVVVIGAERQALRGALAGEEAVVVENPGFAESGPARSLQIGLGALPSPCDAFLLYPVDFPLVTGALVAALRERWEAVRGRGRSIVVPSYHRRRGHPAAFDARLAARFLELPPDAPMHRVLRDREDEVEHLVVDDPAVVMDMDTPEDYRRCLDAWRKAVR